MNESSVIVGIIIILLFVAFLFTTFNRSESDSMAPKNIIDNFNDVSYSGSSSPNFYQDLYWDHMPVTYYLLDNSTCTSSEISLIHKAFAEIQNETNNRVSFKQLENRGDILINCKKNFNLNKTGGTYQVGDALITNIDGQRILSAELNFYIVPGTVNSGSCSYANIEVHEILHVFGFDHTLDRNHIMNPVDLYCPSRLNQDILDKLMKKYG